MFSSGKERMHYNQGREADIHTPATLIQGGQSVTEAVMMGKDCGIVPQDKK